MQQRLQLLAPAVIPYFLRLGGFIVHPRFAQIGQHLVLAGFLSLPRIELGLNEARLLGRGDELVDSYD
jgi:hypothetical protein